MEVSIILNSLKDKILCTRGTGFIKERYGIICVNSGSISLPKNNTQNSYLIINDNEIILKDVEGNIIDKKIFV